MNNTPLSTANYHLPGLFELYDFYKVFLPLFYKHREWFYDSCNIGSLYGAPEDCLWGGGRAAFGNAPAQDVLALMDEFEISPRLTFSNSLLRAEHLSDKKCNKLCGMLAKAKCPGGVILHSDLLAAYLQKNFPELYLVSSTTKVLAKFEEFESELNRNEFKFVVPDFRLNKAFEKLSILSQDKKDKVEFLCNECCDIACTQRKACYENVSRKNLGQDVAEHLCASPDAAGGYKFSLAMKNPAFIGVHDIADKYMPMGFSNFKIEGRGLGSALVLEFILHYMTKPEYQLNVREELYLDSMLDLF